MRRRAILYGMAVVAVLIGWAGGLIVNAIMVEAKDAQAATVLWSKQCAGNRVVVTNTLLVRCLQVSPTPTYRPTPTRAPTEKPMDVEPRQTAQPCGDDPNYWTSCPPTEAPKP